MGTYERKVNQLKDLMRRKYKSAYNKSKEMDIDISSMTYLPCPDAFNVINIEKMHVILDRVNKIIDENKDKLKNPTCATCVHLHDREWAKRYGKVCCSIWQVCDHYINPNRKYDREQKTYTRRPSNKACPNYEYGDDNFENRKRCLKKKECQKYVIWDTVHVMLKDDGELIIKALSKDKSVLLNDFIIYVNNNGSIDEEDYDLLLTK